MTCYHLSIFPYDEDFSGHTLLRVPIELCFLRVRVRVCEIEIETYGNSSITVSLSEYGFALPNTREYLSNASFPLLSVNKTGMSYP